MNKNLKRFLHSILVLTGLTLAFYGIENYGAEKALKGHLHWLKLKGESLVDCDESSALKIPDVDNIAMAPCFECFYEKDASTGKRRWIRSSLLDIDNRLSEAQIKELNKWRGLKIGSYVIDPHSSDPDGKIDVSASSLQKVRTAYEKIVLAGKRDLPAPLPEQATAPLEVFSTLFN